MTRLDPFTDAECRRPGRNPQWWDDDAPTQLREVAAALCGTCPAIQPCHQAAAALGDTASGTWAGRHRRWVAVAAIDDEGMTEFLTVFGPSGAHADLTPPKDPQPVRYGRYWLHPAQLRFEWHQKEAM